MCSFLYISYTSRKKQTRNLEKKFKRFFFFFQNKKLGRGRGGKDWEFGISRCQLSYVGWINNRVLLDSPGNYIQYPAINHNEKNICINIYICAAAAAKSLQSCLTLCDPWDGSPPGSPIPGILQARTLKWVAISFSNAWKWKVKVKSRSRVQLFATPWTAAYQAPPSMGFSRQVLEWGAIAFSDIHMYI